MTFPAIISLIAVAVIVILSCFRDLNVGILGVAAALAIGVFVLNLELGEVLENWPISLFMTLTGVTFMFSCAQVNGTMEKITSYAVRLARTNTALIPIIIFVLIAAITTAGPGNIPTVALMAPVAMAMAGRIGLPAFAMTLLVVGAADGAAFSPIAPTGIIANGLISKMAPELGITMTNGFAWTLYIASFLAQTLINFGGFFIFGGWKWMREQRSGKISIDDLAPKPEPMTWRQWVTTGAIVALIVMVLFFGWDVGMTAFILGAIFVMFTVADDAEAIKKMPWGVIVMVGGMSMIIAIMDLAGGLDILTRSIGVISTPVTANGVLALFSGFISAYSSSSGVVLPMFLPMVPGVISEIGGGDPLSLITSICVGSHLVDTSPLSLFGAMCLATADPSEDKAKLFRNLLIWGLSMAVVGALVCLLFFGVLGLP